MLSEQVKPNDPNYEHLHMLSFAYNPSKIGVSLPAIYGVIVEFTSEPFSTERKLLTCYDSGFTAFYTTQNGGNINGNTRLEYSEVAQLCSFELFIGAQADESPDCSISKRSKKLVNAAAEYLKYTQETVNIKDQQEIQFWLLTSSGVFSGGAHIFEIRDKSSVWTTLFNEVYSISKELQSFGPDKGLMPAASF